MNRRLLSAVIVASSLITAPAAYSQIATPGAADPARPTERTRPLPGERIEARIAYAKAALKITPAQEARWNALAEVLRNQARAMDDQHRARRATANQDQPLDALDRLQQRQAMLAAAATRMNELIEAARPLYAAFTDDQKKEADTLFSRGGHGHRGRWH